LTASARGVCAPARVGTEKYVVSRRRRYDLRAMPDVESIRHDDKAASRLAPKVDDGRFDFYVVMNVRRD
jgi:hypothetical protein